MQGVWVKWPQASKMCSEKEEKSWQCNTESTRVIEQVEIVEIASLANRNVFHKFIYAFLCLLAFSRLNTFTTFRLANTLKPLLTNSLCHSSQLPRWTFYSQYPNLSGFKIHLPIISSFGAKLDYKGSSNAFILSENLVSVLKDMTIIKTKLNKDLASGHIKKVQRPTFLFIFLSLSLVSKHNKG